MRFHNVAKKMHPTKLKLWMNKMIHWFPGTSAGMPGGPSILLTRDFQTLRWSQEWPQKTESVWGLVGVQEGKTDFSAQMCVSRWACGGEAASGCGKMKEMFANTDIKSYYVRWRHRGLRRQDAERQNVLRKENVFQVLDLCFEQNTRQRQFSGRGNLFCLLFTAGKV